MPLTTRAPACAAFLRSFALVSRLMLRDRRAQADAARREAAYWAWMLTRAALPTRDWSQPSRMVVAS